MIIFVVFGHVWRGLNESGLISEPLFDAVDGRIYAFHMPVFFALSAWFFVSTLDKSSVKMFAFRRLVRLLWPIVLWTYIFLGIKVLAGPMTNTPIRLDELFVMPIPGLLHLWFLWALLILNFAFIALKPFIYHKAVSPLVLTIVGFLVVALRFTSLSTDTANWVGQALRHAPFFFVGLLLAQYGQKIAITPPLRLLAIALFSAILFFWPTLRSSDFAFVLQIVLTICVLITVMNLNLGGLLCRLGISSMTIYLAHTIFSAFLRELLLAFGVINLEIHLGLGTLIGLVGPLILFRIALRANASRILGF